MAKRRETQSVDWLIKQIDNQLTTFGRARKDLSLRQKVKTLAEVYENVKDLNVSTVIEHGLAAQSAVERIRLYFVEYPGEIIDGVEVSVVSGISDYPRRIRELRVEQGYQIASGASPDPESGIDLKPDQYLLVVREPDKDAARRWHVANRIRRSHEGSQNRVLLFLMENVGKIVTTEELAYVARNAKEYARRVRELRTDRGYSVATRFTGRPDLNSGQYVLQSKERIADPHDRKIPEDIQKAVYARDDNACRICGWNMARWTKTDPRILELHHLNMHQYGGTNTKNNLIVICSKCHDQVHRGEHGLQIKTIKDSA